MRKQEGPIAQYCFLLIKKIKHTIACLYLFVPVSWQIKNNLNLSQCSYQLVAKYPANIYIQFHSGIPPVLSGCLSNDVEVYPLKTWRYPRMKLNGYIGWILCNILDTLLKNMDFSFQTLFIYCIFSFHMMVLIQVYSQRSLLTSFNFAQQITYSFWGAAYLVYNTVHWCEVIYYS